jgi:hypothetical protein
LFFLVDPGLGHSGDVETETRIQSAAATMAVLNSYVAGERSEQIGSEKQTYR